MIFARQYAKNNFKLFTESEYIFSKKLYNFPRSFEQSLFGDMFISTIKFLVCEYTQQSYHFITHKYKLSHLQIFIHCVYQRLIL